MVLLLPFHHGFLRAAPLDDLTLGEALYMTGDLTGAEARLLDVAASGDPVHTGRSLYLLGRIGLLRGDFRQGKEYFERAAEATHGPPGLRWMALAGIGDALYASGNYEEALRRYRFALKEAGDASRGPVVTLKMALCVHAMGREEEARAQMRAALSRIPFLSGWIGREEEFTRTLTLVGLDAPRKGPMSIYVQAGPLEGDIRIDSLIGPDVAYREVRRKGRSYLEFGPLADPVEAMILKEKINTNLSLPAEILSR